MPLALAPALVQLALLAPATGIAEENALTPPMLFHRAPLAGAERGKPPIELLKRMIIHLDANYPDVPRPRVFVSRFEGEPQLHWFEPFRGLDARVALDQARMVDEGWRALEAQLYGDTGSARWEYLLHLGGADPGGARMTYRWMRVARALPAKDELARRHAGEVADHLEATYPDVDAHAYAADLGGDGSIYLFVDSRTLDDWTAVRHAMLHDPAYVELLRQADGLFAGEVEEALLLDIELDPASTDPLARGVILEESGDLEGAVLSYREAVRREPRNVAVLLALAETLRGPSKSGGDAEGAREYVERALEVEPGNVRALHELGLCLWYLEDLERAKATFREVLEIEPDHTPALFNLGMILKNQEQWEAAIEVFRRHQAAEPSLAFAAYSRKHVGDCLRALGDLDGAIASYRSAAQVRPEWAELDYVLGRALYENRQLADAVYALERSLELREGPDPECGFYLALAHAGLGDDEEARTWYGRAVEWAGDGEPSDELEHLRARAEQAVLGRG